MVLVALATTGLASTADATLTFPDITVGDKKITNIELNGYGDLSDFTVTGITVNGLHGIQIGGYFSDTTVDGMANTWQLTYTVSTASGEPLITDIHQLAVVGGYGAGYVRIKEAAFPAGGGDAVGYSQVGSPTDLIDPPAEDDTLQYVADMLDFAPLASINVVKDISVSLRSGENLEVTLIQQTFSQVPEPTTVIAGALLLLPFGASALRLLRRKA